MRLLTIDIETRPNEVYTWGLWDQNVAINQIKRAGGLLCFAAKFHDSREMVFRSLWADGERGMARKLYDLFCEADAVAGWNSDKFDVRWIQAQFLKCGMSKSSPFAKIDLMRSVKRQVALPSYKLDYVAQWLGVGRKVDTGGFELWTRVLAKEPAAQKLMRKYNINDVRLTEAVFDKLNAKGWVLGMPNASIDGGDICPNPTCGSDRRQQRGYNKSKTRKYARYQCIDCGTWYSSTHCEPAHASVKVCA
jgi:DNA polymerase elongation subunit (family B)